MARPSESRTSTLGALLLALVVGFGTSRGFGLREDELECEEAAAHLQDCCRNLDVGQLECEYEEGCGGEPARPVLSPDAVRCIRKLDCDGVRSRGWCEPSLYGPEAQSIEGCR